MTVAATYSAGIEDVELMRQVQEGHAGAFAALFDRFAARAYGVARAIARDPTRAEDVVQDAFFSVWRSRANFGPQRGSVNGWVMGTVRTAPSTPSGATGHMTPGAPMTNGPGAPQGPG